MHTYLVGGAVRDKLLNLPVTEKDWVVLGETPQSMLSMGYISVGKDFPVFLHPETKEEYALARTERKTAPGYKGFVFHTSPNVTLEQDLIRRDLTINAMALAEDGTLIDPFNGQQDINDRIFRHISPAFAEDPVRILRVARFAARYAHLGFTLAEETRLLMQNMVSAGEVDHLVPERVWAELVKALIEQTPSAFFYSLRQCSALAIIFPELDNLFGIPQPAQHHPEIDCGLHSMLVLEQAAKLSNKPEVRFAAVMHDLGKALSPAENLPHHYGHEQKGLVLLNTLCQRLRVPKTFRKLAELVMQYHTQSHTAYELRPSTLVDLLAALSAFKAKNETLTDFLLACEADSKGRTGLENTEYPQAKFLQQAAEAAASIDTSSILTGELKGEKIGQAIREARIKAVKQFKLSV